MDERQSGREFAFKYIYHLLAKGQGIPQLESEALSDDLNDFLTSYTSPDKEHPENTMSIESLNFGKKIIHGVITHWKEIETKINLLSSKRNMIKMGPVDAACLMIGVFELLHRSGETPFKVAINEAVNLAKKFGGNESYSFINGVLDNFSKSLQS